jgi:iron complex transport system substrate-binding protein
VKIVSLLPSATEIVYALGLGESLQGVTFECDHPADARTKPVVSDTALPQDRPLTPAEVDRHVREFMDGGDPIYVLDKDLIRRIQPDLILAQDLCRVCAVPSGHVQEALDDLGCSAEVISLDPNTVEDILDGIEVVGRATGTGDRAADLTAQLRERMEAVRRRAAGLPAVQTLALEWSDPPFAGGHWVPGMVQAAGGINLLSERGAASPRVTWDQIAGAAPEVIVFMPCGYYLQEAEEEAAALFAHPAFAETPAARGRDVFAVDATSYFSRPGPRIVDGLEILAWAIHPEAFPAPPADRIARVVPPR